MKNHERRHKEQSGTKEKKDHKNKSSTGEMEDLPVESRHHLAADEDMTAGISFLINFSLTEGQIEGTITHCRTNKQMEFAGLDQASISQFMKRYLSRLEKSVAKMPIEEASQQIHEVAEVQKEGARAVPHGEMRTRSFGVIPTGAGQPSEILQQGQPFQLQWSFEPPAMSEMEGEQLHYKLVICGKNLEGGDRLKVGEIKGKIDFGSPLTAHIPSEPLPPGAYRLEAESTFGLKTKKSEWHSFCRERRLIQVI